MKSGWGTVKSVLVDGYSYVTRWRSLDDRAGYREPGLLARSAMCGRFRDGAVILLAAAILPLSGCVTTKRVTPEPVSEPVAISEPEPTRDEKTEARIAYLEEALGREQENLVELRRSYAELERQLWEKEETLVSVEERYTVLETELTKAVDQVIRTEGSVRGLQSRALATSRISEVKVQLQAVPSPDDVEVAVRLEQANEFLNRADAALEKGTYGAASYLAERASELVRQARMVGEIRASKAAHSRPVIPVVPPRSLVVTSNANLRSGPGLDQPRVGGLQEGEPVVAVARSGEWYKVETGSGDVVWIHGRLLD